MRIGIIELSSRTHYSPIITRVQIFSKAGNEITVFTTPEISESLERFTNLASVNVVTKKNSDSLGRFLKRIERNYSFDVLFITTFIPSESGYWFFCPEKISRKTVVTLHSTNTWFSPKLNSPKNILLCVVKWLLLRRFGYIAVGQDAIKEYLESKFDLKHKILVIPFALFDPDSISSRPKHNGTNIRVVVPGIYSLHRRNYLELLDSLERAVKYLNGRVSIDLLGAPSSNPALSWHGERIIERCENLAKKGFPITCYREFLDSDQFSKKIKKADILLAPTNMSGVESETYGVSKDSGIFSDAIMNSLPIIIPRDYRPPAQLKSSTLFFEDYDAIPRVLEKLCSDRQQMDELKAEALNNSRKFTPDLIRVSVLRELQLNT